MTGIGPVAVRCPRVRDCVGERWPCVAANSACAQLGDLPLLLGVRNWIARSSASLVMG
jgi:hypothetical protein